MIFPLLVFIIFIFVWYFPVWRRQGEPRMSGKTFCASAFLGGVPVFLLCFFLQVGLDVLQGRTIAPLPNIIEDSYIGGGLIEEALKFLAAYIVIRKTEPESKAGYALVFGAVGLGYEAMESLFLIDSVLAGVERGVFALHIIWQFWMGLYFWEYRQAKLAGSAGAARKNLCLAFAVPVFLHGTNDFLAFMAENELAAMDAAADSPAPWSGALLPFIAVLLVFQVITFRKTLRAAMESCPGSGD